MRTMSGVEETETERERPVAGEQEEDQKKIELNGLLRQLHDTAQTSSLSRLYRFLFYAFRNTLALSHDRWIEATLLGILLLQTVALSLFPTDEGWSMPVRSILSWIAFLRPGSVSQQMHTSLSILWILVVVISLCSWMIIHYASVSLLESDSLARAHIESPFEFEPLRIAREEWETCPKGNQRSEIGSCVQNSNRVSRRMIKLSASIHQYGKSIKRTLVSIVKIWTSFLFFGPLLIPAGSNLLFSLHCNFLSENPTLRSVFPVSSCFSSGNIELIVIGLISFVLFGVMASIVSLCSFSIFVQRILCCGDRAGRAMLFFTAFRLLAIILVVIGSPSSPSTITILGCILASLTALMISRMQAFYSSIATILLSGISWNTAVGFLVPQFEMNARYWFFLGLSPCMYIASSLVQSWIIRSAHQNLLRFLDISGNGLRMSEIPSLRTIELAARYMLGGAKPNSHGSFRDRPPTDTEISHKDLYAQVLATAELGVQLYPKSLPAHFSYAVYSLSLGHFDISPSMLQWIETESGQPERTFFETFSAFSLLLAFPDRRRDVSQVILRYQIEKLQEICLEGLAQKVALWKFLLSEKLELEYLRRLLLQSFALEMAAEREFRMLFEEHPSSTELVSFYGKFVKYMQNDESTEKRMITRAESLFELEVLEKDWKKNTSKEKIGTSEALHEVQQKIRELLGGLYPLYESSRGERSALFMNMVDSEASDDEHDDNRIKYVSEFLQKEDQGESITSYFESALSSLQQDPGREQIWKERNRRHPLSPLHDLEEEVELNQQEINDRNANLSDAVEKDEYLHGSSSQKTPEMSTEDRSAQNSQPVTESTLMVEDSLDRSSAEERICESITMTRPELAPSLTLQDTLQQPANLSLKSHLPTSAPKKESNFTASSIAHDQQSGPVSSLKKDSSRESNVSTPVPRPRNVRHEPSLLSLSDSKGNNQNSLRKSGKNQARGISVRIRKPRSSNESMRESKHSISRGISSRKDSGWSKNFLVDLSLADTGANATGADADYDQTDQQSSADGSFVSDDERSSDTGNSFSSAGSIFTSSMRNQISMSQSFTNVGFHWALLAILLLLIASLSFFFFSSYQNIQEIQSRSRELGLLEDARLSSVQSLDSSLLFSVLTLTNETKAQTARLQARHNIFRSREMMRSLTRNPARYTEQFYEAVSVEVLDSSPPWNSDASVFSVPKTSPLYWSSRSRRLSVTKSEFLFLSIDQASQIVFSRNDSDSSLFFVSRNFLDSFTGVFDSLSSGYQAILRNLQRNTFESSWIIFACCVGACIGATLLIYVPFFTCQANRFSEIDYVFPSIPKDSVKNVLAQIRDGLVDLSMQSNKFFQQPQDPQTIIFNTMRRVPLHPEDVVDASPLDFSKSNWKSSTHCRIAVLLFIPIVFLLMMILILLSSESSSLMFTSSASRIFYRPSLFRTLGVGVRELLRPALEREAYNSSSLIALIELTNQKYLDSLNVFLNEGFRLSMDKEAKNRLYDLTFSSPCASSTDSIQCWSNYRRASTFSNEVIQAISIGKNLSSIVSVDLSNRIETLLQSILMYQSFLDPYFENTNLIIKDEYDSILNRQERYLLLVYLVGFFCTLLTASFLVYPLLSLIDKHGKYIQTSLLLLPMDLLTNNPQLSDFLSSGGLTHSMRMQENRRENAVRVKAMMHSSNEGVIVANDKAIVEMINKAALKMSGYREEELVGENVSILVPSHVRDRHDAIVEAYVANPGRSKLINRALDSTLTPKNGHPIPVVVRITEGMINDKMFFTAFLENKSSFIEMQKDVEKSEKKIKQILSTSRDGVVIISPAQNNTIVFINAHILKMFDYAKESDIIGKNINILVPSPHKERHDSYIANFLESRESLIAKGGRTLTGQKRRGEIFDARVYLVEGIAGGETFFAAFVRDLSDKKAAEASLHERIDEIRSIISTCNDMALFLVDGDSSVFTSNSVGLTNVLGYTQNEIVVDDPRERLSELFSWSELPKLLTEVDRRASVRNESEEPLALMSASTSFPSDVDSMMPFSSSSNLNNSSAKFSAKMNGFEGASLNGTLGGVKVERTVMTKSRKEIVAEILINPVKISLQTFFVITVRDVSVEAAQFAQATRVLDLSERFVSLSFPEVLLRRMFPEGREAILAGGIERGNDLIDFFEDVTCIFIDIKTFEESSFVQELSLPEKVEKLSEIFSIIDSCAEKSNIERIKTIGHKYLAVSNMYKKRSDHVAAMIQFALVVLEKIREYNNRVQSTYEASDLEDESFVPVELRFGINTGKVMAGIVGRTIATFDLYGDCVNVASRMAATAPLSKIQVSESSWQYVRNLRYHAIDNSVEVKGLGITNTKLIS